MNAWKFFLDKLKKKRVALSPKPPETFGASETHSVSDSWKDQEQWLYETFQGSQDVKIHKLSFGQNQEVSILLVYCEGLADIIRINESVLPSLRMFFEEHGYRPLEEETILSCWAIATLRKETSPDKLIRAVFDGHLVLFFSGIPSAYTIDVILRPNRKPEDAKTEVSIRGPRDAFTESLNINVALIRKRMRSPSLIYEQFTLGKRTQTLTGLLYIKDVIRPEVVEEARSRLSAIDIDAVYSMNELEELMSENPWSIFPEFDYSGRPDYVLSSLLRGRFAILMDGLPTAIIAPANLALLFKAAEDLHSSYSTVVFGRTLRLFGLFISLFLPGIYVAITSYHPDQIPLTLLATIVLNRKGVPLPAPVEAFVMLIMFELFREAGIRLPNAIGQTLAVVGGLIIGDAAIRAGLTSPTLLVTIATTAVATFMLVNQSLAGAVSIVRLFILLISATLGIFGYLASFLVILTLLANKRSFGVPYLAPASPFQFRDFLHATFRAPAVALKKRPKMLDTVDNTRQGSIGKK